MNKEVIFIEGTDLSGKDFFINKYFKKDLTVFYPPSDNFFDKNIPYEVQRRYAWMLTFNTIFVNIEESKTFTNIVYRSPISNYIYNKFFKLKDDLKDYLEYLENIQKRFNYNFSFWVIFQSKDVLYKRFEKRGDKNIKFDKKHIDELYELYQLVFKKLKKENKFDIYFIKE